MGFIGLDIGNYSIKAAQLIEDDDGKFMLSAAAFLKVPSDAFLNSTIIDHAELTACVAKLFAEGGFTENRVALAVKGEKTIARLVEMPFVSKEQFDRDARYFAEQYLAIEPEEYALEYNVLEMADLRAKVLYAATHKAGLLDYMSVVNTDKIKVSSVNIEVLAIAKLYKLLFPRDKDISLVIQNGHAQIQFIFFNNGDFIYHTTSAVAGARLSELLVAKAGTDTESMEKAKMNPSSTGRDADILKVLEKDFYPEFEAALGGALKNAMLAGIGVPEKIYLSGAATDNIMRFKSWKKYCDSPPQLLTPGSLIKVNSPKLAHLIMSQPAAFNVALAMSL